MQWYTLAHVHLDRVAAPWLVRRFVDPEATFGFVPWGAEGEFPGPELAQFVPAGARPLGIPGVRLGMHDAAGSCFRKVLEAYELEDPALWRLERIVAAGVRHAFEQERASDETAEESAFGAVLDEIGTALGLLHDDQGHLDHAFPLYDAVLVHCRVRDLGEAALADAPRLPPLRTPHLRTLLGIG